MKKITFILLVLGFSLNSKSQCYNSLPITEDFNDSNVINVCWDLIDNDGDTYNWFVDNLEGNNGLRSNSYQSGIGNLSPDNWIISQAIDLTSLSGANIELNYRVRAFSVTFDKERYTVYAATGNQISDFESSSLSMFDNLDNSDASGAWGNRTFNVSALAGNIIYIAFRHHFSVGQNSINLDDVSISTASLGIDNADNIPFKHYYNSNSKELTLKSSSLPMDNIALYNILGQNVLNKTLSQTEETIDLSTLNKGIYIGQVSFDNVVKTIKFVKQ